MDPQAALAVAVLIGVGALLVSVLGAWTGHVRPLLAVYAVHVATVLALAVTGFAASPDAALYDDLANRQVDYWTGHALFEPTFTDGKEGWMLVLAIAYMLLTPNPIIGALLNAIVATATAAVLVKLTQRLGWEKAAPHAAWLMLLPGFLVWSSLALREAFVWLFTALAAYGMAGLLAPGRRVRSLLLVAVAVWCGLYFRGSVMAVLVAGLAVGAFLARRRASRLATIACVAALAYVVGPGLSTLSSMGIGADVAQVNRSRASLATAGSGFDTSAYSGVDSMVASLPSTLPRVLVGPYPTELLSLPVAAVVAWAGWMVLLVLAFRGRRAPGRGRWLLITPAASLAVTLAVTSSNYGTMVRLREQIAILLVPLAAVAASGAYRPPREEPSRSDRSPRGVAPRRAVRPDRLAQGRVVEHRATADRRG
jgi:hypothetical protein